MAAVNAVGNALTGSTGTGLFVGQTSPTLITPALGTIASGDLSAGTGVIHRVAVQTFTATGAGTYTPTTGMQYCIIELQAGGGGSSGTTGAGGQGATAGAGAAGGYLRILATAAQIGASAAISVGAAGAAGASGNNPGGAGGNTTITISGSTWTASGGGGGSGTTSSATAQQGGSAGSGVSNVTGANATLIINVTGEDGALGMSSFNVGVYSIWGKGGTAYFGETYGSGDDGRFNVTGANITGFAGKQGVIVITEFI